MTYTETAGLTGQTYNQTVYQIGQLSDGRGGQPGLGLISLTLLDSAGKRTLALSEKGRHLVEAFVDPKCESSDGAWPVSGPARALKLASNLSLGTLTVFLEVSRLQQKFAFEGVAARSIAAHLKISNLPRHLAILSDGLGGRHGHGLIRLVAHPSDERKKLPEVTESGHKLLCQMAAALMNEPISIPRYPRPEPLLRLEKPEYITDLADDDFVEIEFPVNDGPSGNIEPLH